MIVAGAAALERNLAALARRQPELAGSLRACRDDADHAVPVFSGTRGAEFWAPILDSSTPVLLFAADALLQAPPFDAAGGPSLLVVVERRAERLARALRSVELASWLQSGRLALALAGHELELMEALKPLLAVLLHSAAPTVFVAPGLPEEEAQQYRRWGDEAGRFIEFSREPAFLNIEMYQRFKLVADRIDALAGSGLSILDAGGREWTFSAFLPRHRVAVADLETTGTDVRALPHADASFDVVTGHHLLEHVPAPDRMRVLAELVRVARRRVYITGPFSESGCAAEIDRFVSQLAPDNPYLQEHLRLGLPSLAEIEAWLRARGLSYHVEPITRCNTWLLALALTPLQESRPEVYREVTRYYNRRFQEVDRGEPAYQSLIEIKVS